MTHTPRWRVTCLILALTGLTATTLTAQNDRPLGLKSLVEAGAKVEKLAGEMKFTEGPVWVADAKGQNGYLLFSDIPNDVILKWTPGAKPEVFRKPCGSTNGHTLDKEGRLISCEHGTRRVSRTEKDGTVVTLAERYEGKRLNSPNDVVVKSDGSIYFTDPPYGIQQTQEELGFSGVYRIAPDGKLSLLIKDFVRPNGLALSPDEKQLYVNDSEKGHIRVFTMQSDGTLDAGKVFAELKAPGKAGAPDGMKVDMKGNVYCTGPEGVWIFDSKGRLYGKIIPPEVPANVGWGGDDNRTLFMTAQTGLYSVRLKIPGTRPGPRLKK